MYLSFFFNNKKRNIFPESEKKSLHKIDNFVK